MKSPQPHTGSVLSSSPPPHGTTQYKESTTPTKTSTTPPCVLFPSSSISASSSSSSNLSYASSDTRDRPVTPPSDRPTKSFRLPRFSLFGRNTPASPGSDNAANLSLPDNVVDDLKRLQLGNKHRTFSLQNPGTSGQQLSIEVKSPVDASTTPKRISLSTRRTSPMPVLAIHSPVESPIMATHALASTSQVRGGHYERRGRPQTADQSTPRDPSIVPPPSQLAVWSELLHGPTPPNRSATFSSVSDASCSSSSRPNVKKIKSQDSIRSVASARRFADAEASSSSSSSTLIPKAVKTKLRSKSKANKESDFEKVFLAQELHASSASSASEILSPSLVQSEFFVKSNQEPRRKRPSWSPRRSTSPLAYADRQSMDRVGSPTRSNSQRSSVDHHFDGDSTPQQDTYLPRVKVDRQLSTSSQVTTASTTTTGSSNASDNVAPKSPIMSTFSCSGELDLPEGKKSKSATPKRKTYALQFSLDGRYLAAAGSDHLIRVYEVVSTPSERADEIELAQLQRFEEACQKKCSSACPASSFKVDSSNGAPQFAPVFKTTPVRIFASHTGDVMDLSWSKNNFLLSCSSDKTAKLWHPNRTDCLCTFTTSATVSCIDFHPTDDRFFVTGGLDGKLRLWNISARRIQSINDVPGVITAVAFSTTGSAVCVGTHSGSLLTFSCSNSLAYVNTITVKSAAANKSTPASKITSIQPIKLNASVSGIPTTTSSTTAGDASEPEYMTITSNDSRVRIYSIASRRLITRFKATSYTNRKSQIRATPSSDSQFIVSGSEDASIHVWSLAGNASLLASLLPSALLRKKSIKPTKGSPDVGDNSTWRSWSAGSGTVRCAIFAPEKTSALLAVAEDPLERNSSATTAGVKSRIIVSTDDMNGLKVWRTDPQGRFI